MGRSRFALVDHGRLMVRRVGIGAARRPSALTGGRGVSTIPSVSPRKPHLGDDYTTGTFRDGILMIIVILTAIVLIWLAYGWAQGQPGAPAAP